MFLIFVLQNVFVLKSVFLHIFHDQRAPEICPDAPRPPRKMK